MNHDVWGPWFSTVEPNAAFNDICASPANQEGSAVSAVKAWTDAGRPIHRIVLGIASYGHSFSVPPSDAFASGTKTLADDDCDIDVCGVYKGPGGTFNFWGLIDGGFLTENATPAEGIYYRYDECSQTPYVYNEISQFMISFDNTRSFATKGEYIKKTGLRGSQCGRRVVITTICFSRNLSSKLLSVRYVATDTFQLLLQCRASMEFTYSEITLRCKRVDFRS
ncbi:hypothetical protein DFH29DRAFT_1000716 [Suillus ampliporus]|nr:hypothetical protein DFH29DRAFT_1000716 [Suillus ampliporus]